MLVLTRTEEQELIIGDNKVCITILEVRGNKVRIGIEAEKDITIHREEIFNKISDQQHISLETEQITE